MSTEYTLISSSNGMYTEKGSLFKSTSFPIKSFNEIKRIQGLLKKQFADASHLCYAYRLKSGDRLDEFSSDSGEPNGSAGIPILNVLKRKKLIDSAIIVLRYYGGKKLGIPGLIHAYGKAAEHSITAEKIRPWFKRVIIVLIFPFELHKKVEMIIKKYNARIKEQTYTNSIEIILEIKESIQKEIIYELKEISNGNITINI